MRKQHYIKQINHKDIRFIHALRCCNHLSMEQAQSLISKARIQSFIKQGVIDKVHTIHCNKTVTAYAINEAGRRWVNRHIKVMQSYSWYTAATAVQHNLRLAEQYLEITQKYPDRYILTEGDMRDYLLHSIQGREDRNVLLEDLREGKISIPDMGYIRDGELSCIEIINGNYGLAEIQAKEAFQAITGAEISFVRQ